uniref:Uncharacterized protein n=1 Tax=Avena sativa TaxID=4498 RepID=A0ACD5YQC5_AVESA
MGKEQHKNNVSKTYVLKVVMHCQCNGCMKKINDGVREIALSEGVERADLVVETAEVIVVGRTDPEKLCCLLQQLTQKHVKIETQTTVFEEDTPASEQIKNRVCQMFQTPESPGRLQNGLGTFPVTPSAPPLPEPDTWKCPASPCGRRTYRWSTPSPGELGMWAASDVTGTLAVYEL